jgi:hypothetical protein
VFALCFVAFLVGRTDAAWKGKWESYAQRQKKSQTRDAEQRGS